LREPRAGTTGLRQAQFNAITGLAAKCRDLHAAPSKTYSACRICPPTFVLGTYFDSEEEREP
jgi:hypothetical protein